MKDKMKDHSSKGGSKSGEPAAGTPIFLRVSTIEILARREFSCFPLVTSELTRLFPFFSHLSMHHDETENLRHDQHLR